MIREVKSYPLLRGIRGEPAADINALISGLLSLAQLALDFPEIIEAEINPFLVRSDQNGAVAVDARLTIRRE